MDIGALIDFCDLIYVHVHIASLATRGYKVNFKSCCFDYHTIFTNNGLLKFCKVGFRLVCNYV